MASDDCHQGVENQINFDSEQCRKERPPYLVVDYGEQLVSDIADVRDELHKEILSVIQRLHLLWEIVRTFMLFIITVVSGVVAAVILQVVFPRYLAEFCFTASLGITIVLGFLTLNPLMEAVNNYSKHSYYAPTFINCYCEVCVDKGQRQKGAGPADHGDEADSIIEPPPTDGLPDFEASASDGQEEVPSVPETLGGTID